MRGIVSGKMCCLPTLADQDFAKVANSPLRVQRHIACLLACCEAEAHAQGLSPMPFPLQFECIFFFSPSIFRTFLILKYEC